MASGLTRVSAWIAARARWQQLVMSLVAGAVAALGHAPFDRPVALIAGLLFGFLVYRTGQTVRASLFNGVALGSGYFAVSIMWIVSPFLVDAPRYGWMAPFALVFMAVGLALFWGLAFGVARWFGRSIWPLAVTLTAAEMLRAYVFTGFPWGMPAQAMVNGALGQAAAWIGPHGVNLVLFLGVAWTVVQVGKWRRFAVSFVLITAVMWPVPKSPQYPSEGRIIRLIQPNAPQHQKWDPAMMPIFYQRQLDLTAADPLAGGARPDLVIWPETALPTWLQYAAPNLVEIAQRAAGAPVVLGAQRIKDRRLYNSLVVLDNVGRVTAQYDKHHLVPFGEYIPMGEVLARFGLHGFAPSEGAGFSAGPGPRVIDLGPMGRALPLICYEAVFPQDVNNAPVRPDLLLQITNDAWFGEFSGPYQHLAIARMRAIEQGLPMVRVANTGVSAMIDGRGRVTHSIALGVSGFLDAPLPPALAATLYSRTKDWPMIVLLVLALGGLRVRRRLFNTINRD